MVPAGTLDIALSTFLPPSPASSAAGMLKRALDAGYLLVGVLIGPNALAWPDSPGIRYLAEVRRGLPDVRHRAGVQPAQTAQHAAAGVRPRAGQVLLTLAGAAIGNLMLIAAFRCWAGRELSWQGWSGLGAAMAMSSDRDRRRR